MNSVTITIGSNALSFIAGVGLTLLIVLAAFSFERWQVHVDWVTPKRAAGVRRFFKLLFFPVLGVLVTNAATWTVQLLLHLNIDPAAANATGLIVGAAIGGAAKTSAWADVPPAPEPLPPVPPAQ
jgi:hypothetical protein